MGIKRTIKRNAAADDILLEDAFAEFIAEKEAHNLSAATIHSYEASFQKFKGFMGDNNTEEENEFVPNKVVCLVIENAYLIENTAETHSD